MNVRALFDISHPAQVHKLRPLIHRLRAGGAQVLVTARDKDVLLPLLESEGIEFRCLGAQGRGLGALAREWLQRSYRLWRVARRFRPDVMVAEVGVSIGPVGLALGVPRVVVDQADRAVLQRMLGLPFASVLCTGSGYPQRYGRRHLRFRGFLAQTYLDPSCFVRDPRPLRSAGVDPDRAYSVLRLVDFDATHDRGRSRTSVAALRQAVERLEPYGPLYISAETPLPETLRRHASPVAPGDFLQLLAHARLCLSEGGTVGVEAALLGIPTVLFNSYDFGYLQALEDEYEVIERVSTLEEALPRAEQLLQEPEAPRRAALRCRRLFEHTDDVLAVLVQVVRGVAKRSSRSRQPGGRR